MSQSQLASASQVGNSFVKIYYEKIGQNRNVMQLRDLYFSTAEIVWNSQPFAGPDEFCEFVQTMPEFVFKITSTSSQPIFLSPNAPSGETAQVAGTLVTSSGFVVGSGEMTPFTQTFQLFPDTSKGINNAYSIKLDRFCSV